MTRGTDEILKFAHITYNFLLMLLKVLSLLLVATAVGAATPSHHVEVGTDTAQTLLLALVYYQNMFFTLNVHRG